MEFKVVGEISVVLWKVHIPGRVRALSSRGGELDACQTNGLEDLS